MPHEVGVQIPPRSLPGVAADVDEHRRESPDALAQQRGMAIGDERGFARAGMDIGSWIDRPSADAYHRPRVRARRRTGRTPARPRALSRGERVDLCPREIGIRGHVVEAKPQRRHAAIVSAGWSELRSLLGSSVRAHPGQVQLPRGGVRGPHGATWTRAGRWLPKRFSRRLGLRARSASLLQPRDGLERVRRAHDRRLCGEDLLHQDPVDLRIEVGARVRYDRKLVVHVGRPTHRRQHHAAG